MRESTEKLPVGSAPTPVALPHFPEVLHAVIWRNWDVVDVNRLAEVLQGTIGQITEVAISMGLPLQRQILPEEQRRNYMTIVRRNWHLLPYEQICQLLDWDAAEMQFALNEDDFMWVKLGGYKPTCPPVYYGPSDSAARIQVETLCQTVRDEIRGALHKPSEPLFGFIDRFNRSRAKPAAVADSAFNIRMVYPYFLRYGDPLRGEGINDIPDGYLSELAASGVNAIWFQAVLNTLSPWELAPHLSEGWQERIANLQQLVARCRRFGIDVMLYLNEPRAMPRSFFEEHPELKGVDETPERAPYSPDVQALCTSTKTVQDFIVNSVRHVFEQVPDLGGVLVITYSENLMNCYSREYDETDGEDFLLRSDISRKSTSRTNAKHACPRCKLRGPEMVNAEVCALIERGMRLASSNGKFMLYAWSTPEAWFPGLVERLPESTWLLCISEWGMPFTRGDYSGKVNEYSISIIGPSEQSKRQWDMARARGLKTMAKMQAANTFEISSIPYIPALRRVAQHLSNLTDAKVNGVMLGWTAGGSPSPNLELAAEFAGAVRPTVQEALLAVAARRFGAAAADEVVKAWDLLSDAFGEFPFDLSVCYNGPQSLGPANLLYAEPTGVVATMCTFPFDDLDGWRGPYSIETFLSQFQKLSAMWRRGVELLNQLRTTYPSSAMEDEWRIAEAAGIHFQSTVNQIRFIQVRQSDHAEACNILREEIKLARRLIDLVAGDSRIGFEATNQYGYTRFDLGEKILNCRQLLERLS